MKATPRRSTITILAAFLLLAAVAAAAPSAAEWSGTVASAAGDDLALVGVAERFRIAGSISEGLSGRSLAAAALTPGTAVTIHAGEREADGRFRADRVSVQPKSPLSLQGPITGIADDRLSLDILGVRVDLDARTAFSGRGAAGPARSAADLRPGMTVRTALAPTASGSLRANDVRVLAEPSVEPGEDQEFKGTVLSVSSASWKIDDRTLLVDENTVFIGNPGVGDFVEVKFHLNADGNAVAERIKVEDDGNDEVEFRGIVEAIGETSWTISGQVVAVTSATEILGSPQLGDLVEVEAREQADGSLLASKIRREDADDDEGEVEFTGLVEAIGDAAWKIGGREVLVNASTEILGAPAVGRLAEVKAISANGVLTALRIKAEDSGDDGGNDDGTDDRGDGNDDSGDDGGGHHNRGPNHSGLNEDSSGHD